MKKYLLLMVIAILIILFFIIMIFGIHIGPINFYSYKDVKEASIKKDSAVELLDTKNMIDFPTKKKLINTSVNEYNTLKKEYDDLVSQGKISLDSLYNASDLQDANMLAEMMKKYANEENIELNFEIKKSESTTAISSDYVMCDLNYKLKGEYIGITSFIYNVEDNSNLNFEVSNFEMKEKSRKS